MAGERVFSQEELDELSMDGLERVRRSIKSGDTEQALADLETLYNNLAFLHDCATCWLSSLLSYVYRNYGVEALKQAELVSHRIEGSLQMPPPESDDFKTVVSHTIRMLSGHVHQPVHVEEDDEKVTITVTPCGSGNMTVARGWYDYGENGIAKVSEATDITWGLEDFPVYCVHCPVQEMLEVERTGYLKFAHEHELELSKDGKGVQCKYFIYKNRDDIPEKFYERIGAVKPAPGA